jgi:hypothetical protein
MTIILWDDICISHPWISLSACLTASLPAHLIDALAGQQHEVEIVEDDPASGKCSVAPLA